MTEKIIIDEQSIRRTHARLAHEIIEQNTEADTIYLVGIRRRGVPIARRLGENIERFSDLKVVTGELDISFYRDDVTERFESPQYNGCDIPFDVTGKKIVLVDDVICTGRTARAAMEAVISQGRPAAIELCVMVDRGHRELPISANYVGKNIPTSRSEFVSVRLVESDGVDEVALIKRQ